MDKISNAPPGKGGARRMAISLGIFPTVKGDTAKQLQRELRASAAAPKDRSDAYNRATRLRACLAACKKK